MRVIHSGKQLGNPFLSVIMGLVGGANKSGAMATDAFITAQNQMAAEDLAAQRSRRWTMFGGLALGAGALVGAIYLLKKAR